MASGHCQFLSCDREVDTESKAGALLGLCPAHAKQADKVLHHPHLARPEYTKRRKENQWLYQ